MRPPSRAAGPTPSNDFGDDLTAEITRGMRIERTIRRKQPSQGWIARMNFEVFAREYQEAARRGGRRPKCDIDQRPLLDDHLPCYPSLLCLTTIGVVE